MVDIPHGQLLKQEFLKDQFLALFFLIFINDLSGNLISNPKLFANDTSLFSVLQDITLSANNLNDDLKKINKMAFQWKMSFNPIPINKHRKLFFPGILINQITHQ